MQQSLALEAMFDVVIETKDGDLNEKGVSWSWHKGMHLLIDLSHSNLMICYYCLIHHSKLKMIKMIWMIGHATKRRIQMMLNLLATMMTCHFIATIHFSDS